MGSWPTLQLQIAPGYGPTEVVPSGAWVDVTDHMRSANPKRGRQRLLDDFSTGTMPLVMKNTDRLLDPLNTGGTFYPDLVPGMPVRLQAVWSGTTYPLWFGFVDGFELDWPANKEAAVNLPCNDVLAQLAIKKVNHAGYAPVVLADTPTVYWRLGDPYGSTAAADSSGNGRDGTYGGDLVFGAQGAFLTEIDTAVDFLDTGWLEGPSSAAAVGTGDFSVELWVQPRVAGGRIWHQGDGSSSEFAVIYVNGDLTLQFATADGTNLAIVDSTEAMTADAWNHVVVTRNAGALNIAVNGVAGSTVITTTGTGVASLTALPIWLAAVPGSPPTPVFDGALDEVAMYAYALTTTAVTRHYNAGHIPWDSQTTGDRINAIADVVGIPTSRRNIDAGTAALAPLTQPLTGQFALPVMQQVAKCEIGRLFAAADGDLIFHDADHDAAHATTLGSFTDADPSTGALAGGALPYQPGGLKPRFDLAEVSSEVQVTRSGGVTQIAKDPRDPPPYGNRSLELSDLPFRDDEQAAALAAELLALRNHPKWRISPLVLDPRARDGLWPHVLGREIGDLITVLRRPAPGVVYPFPSRIEGIEHNIDAQTRTWKTTWTLAAT